MLIRWCECMQAQVRDAYSLRQTVLHGIKQTLEINWRKTVCTWCPFWVAKQKPIWCHIVSRHGSKAWMMHSARGHPMASLSMKIQIIWGGLGYMTHMSCYIRNTCWQQRLLSFSNLLLCLQGSAKFFLSWAQVIGFPEGGISEYIKSLFT